MAVDFLPVCDLLFNLLSVASYFCDIAFHIIVAHSLYEAGEKTAFSVVFLAVFTSVILCQVFSLKWFLESEAEIKSEKKNLQRAQNGETKAEEDEEADNSSNQLWMVVLPVHLALCAVFWRYARLLFAPIDIALVKMEMRNLSLLRLLHALVQSTSCLLIQAYMMATNSEAVSEVFFISLPLSFANVCWALASFNKHVKRKNVHKLILTWIGVILQFIWRVGTLTSRFFAVVIYASVYRYWTILFVFLHWVCMAVWLWLLRNYSNPTSSSSNSSSLKPEKKISHLIQVLILSYVYLFDFLNMEEGSSRIRMVLYYTILLIENNLLVGLWATHGRTTLIFSKSEIGDAFCLTTLPFFGGLAIMCIYFKVFHVSKTYPNHSSSSSSVESSPSSLNQMPNSNLNSYPGGHHTRLKRNQDTVFNCTLYPAMQNRKQKKKIPRSIPNPPDPFWKQPLPQHQNHQQQQPQQSEMDKQIKQQNSYSQQPQNSDLRHNGRPLKDKTLEDNFYNRPYSMSQSGGGGDTSAIHQPLPSSSSSELQQQKLRSERLHFAGDIMAKSLYDSSGDQGDTESTSEVEVDRAAFYNKNDHQFQQPQLSSLESQHQPPNYMMYPQRTFYADPSHSQTETQL